jgi:hypothetical protein
VRGLLYLVGRSRVDAHASVASNGQHTTVNGKSNASSFTSSLRTSSARIKGPEGVQEVPKRGKPDEMRDWG